jgi:predicted  nucleic acid-binding Zn-ribbon protein
MEDKMFEFMTKMYSDISARFDSIDTKISPVNSDIKDIKEDIKGLKGDIVRMENKLDTNSKALFDGYNQTYEKVVDVENAVKDLSSKVETQEVEIKVIKGEKS